MPSYAYLSCWHMNEHESVAMWKIYQSGAPQGIAIQSTYRRLSEAITDDSGILIGTVAYADYATEVCPRVYYLRDSFINVSVLTTSAKFARSIWRKDTSNMKVGHQKARQWFQYLST